MIMASKIYAMKRNLMIMETDLVISLSISGLISSLNLLNRFDDAGCRLDDIDSCLGSMAAVEQHPPVLTLVSSQQADEDVLILVLLVVLRVTEEAAFKGASFGWDELRVTGLLVGFSLVSSTPELQPHWPDTFFEVLILKYLAGFPAPR